MFLNLLFVRAKEIHKQNADLIMKLKALFETHESFPLYIFLL